MTNTGKTIALSFVVMVGMVWIGLYLSYNSPVLTAQREEKEKMQRMKEIEMATNTAISTSNEVEEVLIHIAILRKENEELRELIIGQNKILTEMKKPPSKKKKKKKK